MAITAAAIIGGSSLLGGMMASDAAGKSADAQLESARIAAEAAKFKPYSITSGFGKSFFDTEKGTAGYEIDPRLAAFRDQLYGQAEKTMAELGSTNPQLEAQKYVDQQMGLLAPTRQAEDMALRQKMLGGGRIGLGLSSGYVGGEGLGLINPDQYGLNLARERANAEIGAAGTQYGQNIYDKLISRGTGLFTSGAGIEQLGMTPLTMGADIGKTGVAAGNTQAQALLTGGMGAANANLAGGLSQANMLQSAGRTAGGMLYNPQPNKPVATPYYSSPSYSSNTDYYNAQNQGYGNTGDMGLMY
jgi:hypothetical protein